MAKNAASMFEDMNKKNETEASEFEKFKLSAEERQAAADEKRAKQAEEQAKKKESDADQAKSRDAFKDRMKMFQ
eukprot:NODE_1181_length_588_cov_162.309833_g1107_i0.p2 GENE.NODE_1181_length_588_cov_162.309833_g1107_i0~~NODE_1181_length_588_cov_162.309833_g1107_i0.p2  ORF type:complete len:74 (-),score=28.16 NODE_1181_length_588_cov_162.309833_g1107_i0:308-529(-)